MPPIFEDASMMSSYTSKGFQASSILGRVKLFIFQRLHPENAQVLASVYGCYTILTYYNESVKMHCVLPLQLNNTEQRDMSLLKNHWLLSQYHILLAKERVTKTVH